jgi:hypothetical protein
MNRIEISATSVAADTDGLATAAVCTGAGPWEPNVATSAGDSLAHLITITQITATNHAGKSATITGTGPKGEAQTETALLLPNGAVTVTSTKYFLTVTSVAISATIGADTMTMGWAANSVSPWKTIAGQNENQTGFNLGIGCTVVTGSPNYSVQFTYDNAGIFTHATITGKTVSFSGQQVYPVQAIRLIFTVAGTVNLTGLQY